MEAIPNHMTKIDTLGLYGFNCDNFELPSLVLKNWNAKTNLHSQWVYVSGSSKIQILMIFIESRAN